MLSAFWGRVMNRKRRRGKKVGHLPFRFGKLQSMNTYHGVLIVLKEIEQDDVLWKARQMQKEAAAKKAVAEEAKTAARGGTGGAAKKRKALSAEDYDFV